MANKETLENVKIVQKSYDEAPYKSKTFYYTQPGRQQMVLKLLGFKTPDLKNSRVLEIGCSFGGNIIPFALENPKAEVIGVDLSSVQIEEGNRIIENLGLENIRLVHQNVLEFDEKLGKFDYIICHGVFSWVNEEVQRGILDVIKNHLSENGSAILSYNTYPGWKNLEVARDVMLFRDEMLKNRGEQINESNAVKYGRGAMEFLSQFSMLNDKLKEYPNITQKLTQNSIYLHQLCKGCGSYILGELTDTQNMFFSKLLADWNNFKDKDDFIGEKILSIIYLNQFFVDIRLQNHLAPVLQNF